MVAISFQGSSLLVLLHCSAWFLITLHLHSIIFAMCSTQGFRIVTPESLGGSCSRSRWPTIIRTHKVKFHILQISRQSTRCDRASQPTPLLLLDYTRHEFASTLPYMPACLLSASLNLIWICSKLPVLHFVSQKIHLAWFIHLHSISSLAYYYLMGALVFIESHLVWLCLT